MASVYLGYENYILMLLSQIITKEDLQIFKQELIAEIKVLSFQPKPVEKLLKSKDVKELLQCSDSTLQYYRNSGKLPFNKVAGTFYYSPESIEQFLKLSA